MTAGAAGARSFTIPPGPRDIIAALRKATGAIVSVADVVARVNAARGGDNDHDMKLAVAELQEAVNQLATDELEGDLLSTAIARDLLLLGAEMRGLRALPNELRNTVHQVKAQNDELRANRDNLIRLWDELAIVSRRVLELERAPAGGGATAVGL